MLFWCRNLVIGIFFALLKTSLSGDHWLFPQACYDDVADVTPLHKNEVVDIAISKYTPAWMNLRKSNKYGQSCDSKPCLEKHSITCQKTFDLSQMLKKNLKLYVKVKVMPEEIPCWQIFSSSIHWPDTNFTFAVKFNTLKMGSSRYLNITKISVQVGTCRNCFKMETQIERFVKDTTWHVQLPRDCSMRMCLEYRPFTYTVSTYGGSYRNEVSKIPCYVTFEIMDHKQTSRVRTCLKLSWEKHGALPYENKLLLVLKIDGVTFMEFHTGILNNFWCLPENWLRQKSTVTLLWQGCKYDCCEKNPWRLYIKSNITAFHYYHMCNRSPYKEKNATYLFTTTSIIPDEFEVTGAMDHHDHYSGVLEWTILPASLCTAFVTIISIIVVVCVIRRRRLRATSSTNRNIHQRPHSRCRSRPVNNTTYCLTQMEELTPVIPTSSNNTDTVTTDLDPPPPYPDDDMAPPSYYEVCRFLPTQSSGVQK
ncbi:uncharacterized protein LOC132543727 isoform X2 [Ylistrum balloti]|uniref:uncharacterized protein LOC132543727 isoform X2 n=1 Tax=Ylistrum balloti TaxID=509963 RepID=UPI002905E975|nr:uncharacterized protein LOC132543727 isoform X2 [Ylistrum balloti]